MWPPMWSPSLAGLDAILAVTRSSLVRAVARGEQPVSRLKELLAVALAADEHGWWETEAVCALLEGDPLAALHQAAWSLDVLVHNIRRPPRDAALPPHQAAMLALIDHI
ncbi:MAG: hypothetical protein ACI8S6_003524 [Myxococcota bacterium]|jgi:hypothetical protein